MSEETKKTVPDVTRAPEAPEAPEAAPEAETPDTAKAAVEAIVATEAEVIPAAQSPRPGRNPFKSKKFKYGGLSVLFTVIFVAAIVLVNVITNTLLSRFDVRLDLTENRLFSIEDSTAEYLGTLTGNITIIFASTKVDFEANGTNYSQTSAIAEKFADSTGRVSVEYIDMLQNPTLSGEYGGELTAASIVVKSEETGRYKVLSPTDYNEYTYYSSDGTVLTYDEALMYSQYFGMTIYTDISAAAEGAFLSAIMSVSEVSPVRVAFTTGYNEGYSSTGTLLYAGLGELLETNAYIVEELNVMMVEEIDPELDYLIIFSPGSDYSNADLSKIDKWLDNGGDFGKNVIYVAPLIVAETPNLDNFLADWGLAVDSGIAFQTNSAYMSSRNDIYYLQVKESSYSFGLGSKNIMGDTVRPVRQVFETHSNMETKMLLQTYDGTVIYPFDADDTWDISTAEQGVHGAAAESTKTKYVGTTPYVSRVLVFGSPYMFDATYLAATQLSNSTFYMNIFNTISGKEATVTLKSKSYAMTSFEITEQQANTIAVIFVIVLPLVIIAAGIAVYVRRRYR